MNTEEAIERVKVICAPPGSVLVFCFPVDAMEVGLAHARRTLYEALPEYRVLVNVGPVDIHAIVPESPPPVTNHYNYSPTYGSLAHLGPPPTAKDIDDARREEWANFPREDIA